MTRTRVKVCGITRVEDALSAVDLGADALGLVFWPASARHVTLEQASAIAAAVPPLVSLVGVFVNQPLDEIERCAAAVGLAAIQLHGDEPPDTWVRVPERCIKAIAAGPGADLGSVLGWPHEVWPLVDAHDPVRRGGTGRAADWAAAAEVARQRPLILAGGLDAANVGRAIARVRPFAVDVSSGVEREPGIKDPNRLRAFLDAVAAADAAGAS